MSESNKVKYFREKVNMFFDEIIDGEIVMLNLGLMYLVMYGIFQNVLMVDGECILVFE